MTPGFGLPDPPSFRKIDQNGGTNYVQNPQIYPPGWGVEEALDIEWAHAIAPGANILLVEANSASDSDMMAAIDRARNTPGVTTVSMSWGEDTGEMSNEAAYDSHFTTPAGHAGVTFLASTGDSGTALSEYPAFSPNVVAVGGTTLTLWGPEHPYGSETAWSETGGGQSQYESEPTYQYAVQHSGWRQIPDVSFDADPSSGVPVYDSHDFGEWQPVGGTSLSSPCWAGLVAIADQLRASQGLGSLTSTQTLSRLYEIPSSDFHDVTSGNNGLSAGAGYDMVTGLGTPIANSLVPDLAYSSAPDLYVLETNSGNFRQGDVGDTYTITVCNDGDSATSGAVSLVDALPAGLTATAFSGNGWTVNLSTLTATRTDSLAPFSAYPPLTLTVNVANDAAPIVTNAATVSGGGEAYTGNDTSADPTAIAQIIDLTADVTHSRDFKQGDVGDAYTITVSNHGDSATSGTVSLVDALPTGLTATAFSGSGWTVNLGTLTATRTDSLAAFSSYPPLTLTVNVAASAQGMVADSATVSGGTENYTDNDTALDPTVVVAGTPLRIWDGGGSDNNWTTAANWVGDVAPAAGDRLVFSGSVRQSTVNDFPSGTTFDEITFLDSGFTLSGNSVTLDPPNYTAIDDVGADDVIGLQITIASDCMFSVIGSGALDLNSAAGINLSGHILAVDCGANSLSNEWAGVVTGSGELIKTGAGTLTLTGASTYSGNTYIQDGKVAVAGADNRLPTTTTVTLGLDGVLQLGDGTTSRSQTLAGLKSDANEGGQVVGGGTGVSTLTLNMSQTCEFDGILGGDGSQNNLALAKIGTGQEILYGENTYGDGTLLSAGSLKTYGASPLGTGPVTLAGGTLSLYNDGSNLFNDIVVQANTTSHIFPHSLVGMFSLSGNISGSGTLCYSNSSAIMTLQLSGDNSAFAGTFEQYQTGNGSIATPFMNRNAGSAQAAWQVDSGVFTNRGYNYTQPIALGSLSGGSTAVLRNDTHAPFGNALIYQIGARNESTTFSGTVVDNNGNYSRTVGLDKVGTGTLTRSGANTCTGVTTIENGTLQINNATSTTNVLTNAGGVNITGGSLVLDYTNGSDPASTVKSILTRQTTTTASRAARSARATRPVRLAWAGWTTPPRTR
jgi:uncharacterized repeat protein (TIGR01451 family)